jgi:hypothetical protein
MTETRMAPDEKFGWWICACVKRDRKGRMTHIAYNPPTRKKCGRCGCVQKPNNRADATPPSGDAGA